MSERLDLKAVLDWLLPAVRDAGHAVMEVASSDDWGVEWKPDQSPVTRADRLSEGIIWRALQTHDAEACIVSEEHESLRTEGAKDDSALLDFWCVDPLDGTKEFLHRTGEFAINVAKVENGRPVFGMIHLPATGEFYAAWAGGGAWYLGLKEPPQRLHTRVAAPVLEMLGSRFHGGGEVELLRTLCQRPLELRIVGSAIKFCRLAEGAADLYVRHRPTSEWDTAAGQAILEEAGGGLFNLEGEPLTYGKPGRLNSGFVGVGDLGLPWRSWLIGSAETRKVSPIP